MGGILAKRQGPDQDHRWIIESGTLRACPRHWGRLAAGICAAAFCFSLLLAGAPSPAWAADPAASPPPLLQGRAEPPSQLLPPRLWAMAALLAVLGGGLLTWRYISLWRMHHKLLSALSERDQALSALRLTQDRMQALFVLAQMDSEDTTELIRFALEEGVRLTGSERGFLFFVEGENIDLSRVHWSASVHSPPRQQPPRCYPLSQGGAWAECLRTKAPSIINDFMDRAENKDLPKDHAPIHRFMAVPLVENEVVVAMFGMANKAAPFDENDIQQLQLFLMGVWRVLAARRDGESIRQARDYAESLIEGANAMLVGLDREGNTTLFNASAERISGYARAEVLGRDWCATMLPDTLAGVCAAQYRNFMAGQATLPQQHEGLLRTKGGQVRHVSWQNSLLKQGGTVTGVLAFGIDITERKQAEAELKRLHRAIEQAAEGVLILDHAGIIVYANPAFKRIAALEQPEAQLKGQSVSDLHVTLLDHHSALTTGEPNESTWRGTCVLAKPGTHAAEVEFTVSAIRSQPDSPVSYVAVCRDVTEKRLLERQLWQAQKMDALGTLAGGIAHDFNNLLASIMGFTELARDDMPEQAQGRAYLERVLAASMRARELVRQILSFSRRDEHKLRHLNADAVVGEALKLLVASLSKAVEIRVELEAGATILADPSQVHQIVMNLCTNSAQAMGGAGGRLTVRTSAGPLPIDLAARHRLAPGEYLTLRVEDQGPGIPPDIITRVFDPFFTTKGPGEGTGLGLAVVHSIVTSLGGLVRVESGPGQGACFQVHLPTQTNPVDTEGAPLLGTLRGVERILMVDDEQDLLDLGQKTLGHLGYRVATEKDSEQALRMLAATPQAFDLAIVDVNMPRRTGLQLAEDLRLVRADMPIVLITGSGKAIAAERLQAIGAVKLLSKPFSMVELAHAVRQSLYPPAGEDR